MNIICGQILRVRMEDQKNTHCSSFLTFLLLVLNGLGLPTNILDTFHNKYDYSIECNGE